jgi:hypothetical protein
VGLSIWASIGHVWAILHLGGKPNPTGGGVGAGAVRKHSFPFYTSKFKIHSRVEIGLSTFSTAFFFFFLIVFNSLNREGLHLTLPLNYTLLLLPLDKLEKLVHPDHTHKASCFEVSYKMRHEMEPLYMKKFLELPRTSSSY